MVKNTVSGLIFDVDGTIIDSISDQFDWLKHCCLDIFGVPFSYEVLDNKFKNDYNDGHRSGLIGLYNNFGMDYEKHKDLLWKHYEEWKKTCERPVFPEMAEAIKEIHYISKMNEHSICMMINTTNSISSYEEVLNEAGILCCMDEIIDYEYLKKLNAEKRTKPDTFSIELCLDKMGTTYDNTTHLVDTVDDIESSINKRESKETGLDIIAVTWGYESRDRLEEAKKTYSQLHIDIIDTASELVEIVKAKL